MGYSFSGSPAIKYAGWRQGVAAFFASQSEHLDGRRGKQSERGAGVFFRVRHDDRTGSRNGRRAARSVDVGTLRLQGRRAVMPGN